MPTYQYACTECEHRLEVVQSFSDDPLAVCTACGGRLRKVFSPVGIVFKGSGFYRNDSRRKDRVSAAADSGSTGGSGKDDSAGKDSAASGASSNGSSGSDKKGSGSGSGSSGSGSSGSGSSGSGSSGSGSSGSGSAGAGASGAKSSSSGSKVA